MEPIKIMLVKPHPPIETMERQCPVPEKYKYAWEPLALKIIAQQLQVQFNEQVDLELWHLIEVDDDSKFLRRVSEVRPDLVIFTEIDILLNEVNRIAVQIKKDHPEITTLVGGKHTSLLRNGDRFPFKGIDYAIRGDGPAALLHLVQLILDNQWPAPLEGLVLVDEHGIVTGEDDFSPRDAEMDFDNSTLHAIPIFNHPLSDYLENHQQHPTMLPNIVRTSPIFTGTGCPFSCYFCQSPVEYGKAGLRKAILTTKENVAKEIAWLYNEHNVRSFFSLEPNLNFKNLLEIYKELEKYGIKQVPISGFVRAADVIKFKKNGILDKIIARGVRTLSIGLDVSFESKRDIYNKSFSYNDMTECLDICEKSGILVLSTVVGNPDSTPEEMQRMLDIVKTLPVAEVDVRLAIALRNTKYYDEVQDKLFHHPDKDPIFFDQQNYRYQTIQFPGKITPDQSYKIIHDFFDTFLTCDSHIAYVERFLKRHPESIHYFRRIYEPLTARGKQIPLDLSIKEAQRSKVSAA